MLVLLEPDLIRLQTAIGTACRSLVDNVGRRVNVPTIEQDTLYMAAMIAVQMCAGELVADETKPLRLASPKQSVGPLKIIQE